MVAFVRQLCAAPFKIVLFLLRIFKQTNTPLVRLIWRIGGEIEYANMLVSTLAAKDIAAARQEAKVLLQKTQDARIAATMATSEFYMTGDIDLVHKWILDAEGLNCKYPENLLLPKLLLCDWVKYYDTEQIAGEIISRNDLRMQYTSLAQVCLAEKYIEQKKWEQADGLLDYVLSIEAQCSAFGFKWVTETYKGDHEKAQSFFEDFKKITPPSFVAVFEALGYYYLGSLEGAKECLLGAMREYNITRDYIFFVKKELLALLDDESVAAED